ncbi:condensin complex subunit 3 isoform X4 [Oncorhynchus kisutch]|uniref:condensin complex subunit 3 isoform X4 n=1 Tax=Oncorhynchus kisutch TaxID=8019 RepID=UPI0012DEBD2B|nr:condensin complex subunit 3-like isoform X4 [Oncorhynchus kisutch]XP_031670723.1 condensin complex subunit 3-like isoform X4 [Oncorhynchus kisutch]XP_031670724.1 condensin complex subunit 3-like isoform X4 [Oncorhynchus kisutch]
MTGESELAIKEAFQRAQKGHNNKAKLVASLKNTYNKLEDKTLFHEEFIQYLKHAMIVYKREPAVENVIEFVSKFSTSFHTPSAEGGEEEDEEEDENPFLSYMFNFLLESHKANSHAVRFRVCQLINKLLGSMAENAQIDDDLFDGIHQAMLVRVTDKFPNVRIQASLAMARLQEPQNHQCPTVNAYLLILENDSNPEVRRAVLSCIAPSSLTLPKILKRTRDVKESVRKLAYQVLSDKVHIRALSIAQRVSLLQQGLHDAAESVREVVQVRLLPAWLNLLQGDVLELLHKLDVENCSQTALDTLTALFTHTPQDQLLHHRLQLDDRMLVPAGSLSCESVLYWRALCEFVKTKGDEGEEMLEKLLPEAATFAEYLYGYVKCVPVLSEEQKGDFAQLELVMTKEFISQQLIHLTGCLDTNEEGGRKRVVAVLQEMLVLPQTPPSLVSLLTEKLLTLIPDDHRRIQTVAEVISEVREPIVIRQPLDENENRRKQVKLAEVKVGILEAKQALEECISNQEFNRAAELKDSITDLENLRNNILQEENTQQDDKETETRMEKTDPETLLRCLTMCVELLKQMNIKTRIGPTMSAILSSLILPSISNAQPAVRNMAVVCLGTCALHSKDLVNTHLVLLLQIAQLDEAKIRISALRSVIDLLLLYGFTLLSERPSVAPQTSHSPANQEDQEKGEEPEEGSSTAQSILMMLSDFLDSEVSELRTETAEGLAKLMYSGRISSAKLLSRLVLLWYNPVTEDDTRLRHCLGVFFQLYARESRAHQECVEECFLPTLQTLLNAPATSPLAEVDVTNVAELLVELTRPSSLIKPGDTQEVCVHDYLAVRVCGEMLKDPSAPEVRLYAKVLNSLELSADGNTTRDLVTLLQQVTQEVKDRIALRAVEKLIGQLQDSNNQPDLSTTTLQPVDVNTEEAANQDLDQSAKRPRRGQRKPSTAKGAKKSSRSAESSEESDGENVPDSVPVPRPSRRAKTAALDKTRLDLSALINQEANTS